MSLWFFAHLSISMVIARPSTKILDWNFRWTILTCSKYDHVDLIRYFILCRFTTITLTSHHCHHFLPTRVLTHHVRQSSKHTQILSQYCTKIREHRVNLSLSENLRFNVSSIVARYQKTEDDLVVLQSVWQIIGDVLKRLDDKLWWRENQQIRGLDAP